MPQLLEDIERINSGSEPEELELVWRAFNDGISKGDLERKIDLSDPNQRAQLPELFCPIRRFIHTNVSSRLVDGVYVPHVMNRPCDN